MKKQLQVYLPLAVVALASWLISDWIAPKPAAPAAEEKQGPDAFSQNFTKTEMTSEGRPRNKLHADSMIHYKANDTTELENPIFTVFDDKLPPWIVRSQSGTISSSGEEIFLGGRVFIDRAASDESRPVEIITQDLTVKPKLNYAETDEFAELTSNHDRISGIGLNLYFGEIKKIRLISNVRGKYEAR